MTITYTEALFIVFGAVVSLAIVLVLGLVFLWLSLRGHHNVLLAEIRAAHAQEGGTLARLVESQAKSDIVQMRVTDAAHTFKSAADTIQEVFAGMKSGTIPDEVVRAQGKSTVTTFSRDG